MALVIAGAAGGVGFAFGSKASRDAIENAAAVPAPSAASTTSPISATALASSPDVMTLSSSSSAAPTSLEKAASGDLHELKLLEIKSVQGRTPEEALAIAAGYAALARADATRLSEDLVADPKLFADRSTMAYLYRLALDPDVAPTLLAALARIDSPVVADFLYDLVARGEPGARLVVLAEDLLRGPVVLPKASKPLALVLDLRAAKTCERGAALVERASAIGDERAVPWLERYRDKKGCGPKRADDCFGCLRGADQEKALEDAIVAAKSRSFDAPWSLK